MDKDRVITDNFIPVTVHPYVGYPVLKEVGKHQGTPVSPEYQIPKLVVTVPNFVFRAVTFV